jgi:demethylmenaquinone methyltransferase/2-methoxy-6-polyprenyl-1,4-benzoquinol methylase
MIKQHGQLAEQFFSGNAATYDQIASFSTLGLDGWWKRKILNKIPKTSNRIIEQASGTGILTCKIARLFPKCRIIGVELHEEYVSHCQKKGPRPPIGQCRIYSWKSRRGDFGRGI